MKEAVRIKSSRKAFSLQADSGTEAGVLEESESGLAQDVQIQGRHIFPGPGGIFLKDDI